MWQNGLPIILGMMSLFLIVIWQRQFNQRIEPRLRGIIARKFNVEITRSTHWRVKDSRGAGCQLLLWEFLVIFVVGACVPLLILAMTFLVLLAVSA